MRIPKTLWLQVCFTHSLYLNNSLTQFQNPRRPGIPSICPIFRSQTPPTPTPSLKHSQVKSDFRPSPRRSSRPNSPCPPKIPLSMGNRHYLRPRRSPMMRYGRWLPASNVPNCKNLDFAISLTTLSPYLPQGYVYSLCLRSRGGGLFLIFDSFDRIFRECIKTMCQVLA